MRRTLLALVLLVALLGGLAACSSEDDDGDGDTGGTTTEAAADDDGGGDGEPADPDSDFCATVEEEAPVATGEDFVAAYDAIERMAAAAPEGELADAFAANLELLAPVGEAEDQEAAQEAFIEVANTEPDYATTYEDIAAGVEAECGIDLDAVAEGGGD